MDFHLKAGVGDENIDILMKRPAVGTVSITQVSNINEYIKINYKEIVQWNEFLDLFLNQKCNKWNYNPTNCGHDHKKSI